MRESAAVLLIGGGMVYLAACLAAFAGLFRRYERDTSAHPFVSVIVPARNAAACLNATLGDLIAQDYPPERFQIIVVDDCSEDTTRTIADARAVECERLTVIDTRHSTAPYRYKKRAVFEGIQASRGEIIATVDADCRIPSGWLSIMISHMADDVELTAGMVLVERGGLMGWIEALEFGGIQAMAAGLMNAGFPITCNGANLLYRREAFERVRGFEGIGELVSGDDDLLMQKIAGENPRAVRFVMAPHAAVKVDANPGVRAFLSQRTRWASKIAFYPSRRAVALLAVFFGFFALIPLWAVGVLTGTLALAPLIVAGACKVAGDTLLTGYGAMKAGRPWLMILIPFAEILHVPYLIAVPVCGRWARFKWRGRTASAVTLEYEESGRD
jgi:cellulose synthase/poly-beta-1,6-N-acetylglucosamine synthase-like glycosyltransferase